MARRLPRTPLLPQPVPDARTSIDALTRGVFMEGIDANQRSNNSLQKDGTEDMTAPFPLWPTPTAGLPPALEWEGTLLYDTDANTIKWSNGGSWIPFIPNVFQGSNPVILDDNLQLRGTTVDRLFQLNANAGQFRSIHFMSAGSLRWAIDVNNTAESGGNAGSDFVIARFADNGAFLSSPVNIRRSDGRIFFGHPFEVPSTSVFLAQGGTEGGEINLQKAPSGSSLGGDVIVDTVGNMLRAFEGGGSFRGIFADFTQCDSQTDLLKHFVLVTQIGLVGTPANFDIPIPNSARYSILVVELFNGSVVTAGQNIRFSLSDNNGGVFQNVTRTGIVSEGAVLTGLGSATDTVPAWTNNITVAADLAHGVLVIIGNNFQGAAKSGFYMCQTGGESDYRTANYIVGNCNDIDLIRLTSSSGNLDNAFVRVWGIRG